MESRSFQQAGIVKWRLFLAAALAWSLLILALYLSMLRDLSDHSLRLLREFGDEFFLWQALGFVLITVILSIARPRLLGRGSALYLVLSTLALLALASSYAIFASFLFFSIWCLSTLCSIRILLKRWIGDYFSSWGLAAGLMYCAMIPVSFILGSLRILTPWSVAAVALAGALPGASHLIRSRQEIAKSFLRSLDSLNAIGTSSLGALWVLLALAFAWAHTPEVASDSIRVHLPAVQQIVRDHGFTTPSLDFYRMILRGVQGVYAMGFAVGAFTMTKMLSWFSVVALAILVSEEVSLRSGQKNLGAFAAATTISHPLLLRLSTSLYHDHVITLVCVTAFIVLFRSLEKGCHRGMMLSAFAMGCTLQTKYNTLLFGVVWAVTIVGYDLWKARALRVKNSVVAVFALGLAASPWYIYTFLTTGNPIFPWLNEFFNSPFWPEGVSADFGIPAYRFEQPLAFPWLMTFDSSRITHGPDGSLGFQILALIPFFAPLFLMLFRGQQWRTGADLGLAGLGGLLVVCVYTQYARYWLPVYPILVISLVLTLGEAVRRANFRLARFAPFLGPVLFSVLLAVVPFWMGFLGGLPWHVYTGKSSAEDWMTTRFPGYPAVMQLNEILEAGDKVLATGYRAVYSIEAEAYEFPYWKARIAGVRESAALESFINSNGIRYWVVSFSGKNAGMFDVATDAHANFWTESRLVSASHSVAVFDVSLEPTNEKLEFAGGGTLGASILPKSVRIAETLDSNTWQDRYSDDPERAARVIGDLIELASGSILVYEFSIPEGATLCRARIGLRGGKSAEAHVALEWLNDQRERIHVQRDRLAASAVDRPGHFFGPIPEGATYGRLVMRASWRVDSLKLGETVLDFGRPKAG